MIDERLSYKMAGSALSFALDAYILYISPNNVFIVRFDKIFDL